MYIHYVYLYAYTHLHLFNFLFSAKPTLAGQGKFIID